MPTKQQEAKNKQVKNSKNNPNIEDIRKAARELSEGKK